MGGSRLAWLLPDMLTSGIDVVEDNMLGRRCRLSEWLVWIVLYMLFILCWVVNFFRREQALVGDSVSRKYWHRSVRGIVGGHAMEAMLCWVGGCGIGVGWWSRGLC